VAEPPFDWRPIIRRRVLVAAVLFAVWTIGIQARLINLQVINHDELVRRAESQHMRTVTSPAKRGEIYDRRGRLLAYSVDADTIYAVPYEVSGAAQTAAALCGALDGCTAREQATIAERLGARRAFQYVRRQVTPLEARRVAALQLDGIGFMKESRRFYPNRELAAHLLGYVGMDNVGLNGIEAAYDTVVRGQEGKLIVQTDARRQAFGRLERMPTSGGSLELTIDERLQYIVERELRAGVEEKRADGGSVVVLDPRSGEILALASWPVFNPNAFNKASEVARRNRAVQDLYEPGSTFKVVTMAAALEEGVMPPDALIDTNPGTIRFRGRVVTEFGGRNYGVLSFTDAIVRSSNVGAIKIGLKLGPERLGLYVNRFGFGRSTSPDFPGENRGIVWNPARLDDSGVASVSMGYQVAVTPLQMAAAMNAVANGGTWIEPRVVRAVIRDGVRTRVEPKTVRRAVSERTTAQMLPILEQVVERGTARAAQVAGYTVAGKTGTADKLINGRYSRSQQNVSFLGFVPSRDPVLTMIVMIDTPRVGSDTGGAVAAPIFSRIARAALRHLGVPPTVGAVPPVVVARRDQGGLTTVGVAVAPPLLAPSTINHDPSVVPDVRGMSAREAVRLLTSRGLSAQLEGSGTVVDQEPAPGTALEAGVTCRLTLDRDPPRWRSAGPAAGAHQ
jgi:cell division protein FtsI (penicillin-binding protein 3)